MKAYWFPKSHFIQSNSLVLTSAISVFLYLIPVVCFGGSSDFNNSLHYYILQLFPFLVIFVPSL